MKSVRILSLVLTAIVCASIERASAQAPAAALPAGVQRVTSVEGISEYSLANGLRVLLFPDPSKATVTVNVTDLVGELDSVVSAFRRTSPAKAGHYRGPAKAGHYRSRAPSIASSCSLVAVPPGAEKPPVPPRAASTRWHGTMMGMGFLPNA